MITVCYVDEIHLHKMYVKNNCHTNSVVYNNYILMTKLHCGVRCFVTIFASDNVFYL